MPYRKTIQEIETACQSDLHKGLSEEEAQRRQKEQGKNILNKKKKVTLLQMFLEQFQDPMVIILIIGAIVSIFLKEYMDACIILVVIVLNAIIGVIQEFKAEKAIDALEKLSEPKAYVLRDGYLKEINSEDLVVGDIVELEAGRYIPADMRLLTSTNLKVEESTLTGESEAIEKQADIVYPDEMHIADQRNMVFMSTYVTYGKAQGMVVRCGMDSEVGKIARMLDETKEDMTPLQQRLAHLSKILGMLSLGVCAAMFVVAILQGRNLFDMLLLSISLAVAAIPEGLPAVVTIVLALGVQVMSKQNAIVRKLHAVETLGSVSVICSDKTGTLTQNKMHVVSSYANGMLQEVNDELLKGMVLCNDASISQNEVLGEPTETALLCFGEKQGFHKKDLDMKYVRVNEIPFDSNRKRMTTIHQHEREVVAYTKGALEKILAMCTSVWQDGKAVRMSNYEKQRILEASRQVSEDAQRVLALARKTLKSPYEDDVENKMCFIGFVGLMDPPREEVKDAIARCYKAGIRVAMITGDHPLTALAIARRLGIAKQETEVITGNQLDAMSDEELCASVKGYRVFARVTPQHKVRIVQAFKQNDMVVAMGGDGVN
ncbi:MAG: cation-translocating P-type ATPase, partial [Longicatena caecimuris]